VEGVNGGKMNPIWPIVNETLKLRNFLTDFSVATNIYKEEYIPTPFRSNYTSL
jgi:polyamine oxidase